MSDIELRLIVPGVLGYLAPLPPGVPRVQTTAAAQLGLAISVALANAPADEREAIAKSARTTFYRANYHRRRFLDLRSVLDQRRGDMPGEIIYDELASCVHYELQARV